MILWARNTLSSVEIPIVAAEQRVIRRVIRPRDQWTLLRYTALLCKAEGCNCFKNLESGIRTNSTDTVADLFTSSSSLLNDCRSNQIEQIAQRSTLLNYLSHSSAMAKLNESAILTTLLWRPGKIPIFEHLILRFNTFLYCFNFCIFQLVVYKA